LLDAANAPARTVPRSTFADSSGSLDKVAVPE
jgi:hypothetical protein